MKETIFALIGLMLTGSLHAESHFIDPRTIDDADRAEASRFVAQQKAEREARKDLLFAEGDVSEALGLSRFYKVGDRWIVAVSRISFSMMRKTDEASQAKEKYLEPLFYQFKVTAVDPKAETADVEVTHVGADGKAVAGDRVVKAAITIDRNFHLLAKRYFHKGATEPVIANLGGRQNIPMGFDSFPIELPDFTRAKVVSNPSLPPKEILTTLSSHLPQRQLNPKETLHFESPDLFQRKIRVTWQKGDLWPAYVETPSGYSAVILQEKI